MRPATDHLPTTLWMVDDIPSRMVFAGRRWKVTDTPTRLRHSIWSGSPESNNRLCGWRFQGTDDNGLSLVFDVFREEGGWHVHRSYD